MSSNHKSQSIYVENEKEIRRANRLDNVYFITTTIAVGAGAGTTIGFVIDMIEGSLVATGAGTLLGGTLGLLIGAIWLLVKRQRSDDKLLATIEDGDDEPPESV